MKNGQHKVYGHDHGTSGGGNSSHIPDGHLHDHHDYKELDFRSIMQFMVGLTATVAVSYLIVLGMFKFFEANHEANDPPLSPVAASGWNNPGPEIQAAPHIDLVKYEEEVETALAGEAEDRIPIDQAMKAVVAEGLPYQEKSSEEVPQQESTPSETTTSDDE